MVDGIVGSGFGVTFGRHGDSDGGVEIRKGMALKAPFIRLGVMGP